MAIENFDEIQKYINDNMDKDENIKNYIGGFITSDRVESFLNTEDGKKLLQPKLDSYHAKGLKTWQENNLSKLVDDEVKKRFPETDPKDTEIIKLKADFENMKKEAERKELTNKALKVATDKKLPTAIINYFVGDDEDTTTKNLEALEKAFNDSVNSVAEERLKSGYKPPKNPDTKVSAEEQAKAEINKYFR